MYNKSEKLLKCSTKRILKVNFIAKEIKDEKKAS